MNFKDIDKRVERMLAGVRQAFRGVIGRVDSSGDVLLVQGTGLAGEAVADAEYFQHYGFTSNPPAGAMKVLLPVGGKTSHSIIVATEHASYRMKALAEGALALYTDEGDSIVLNRGRVIDITTKTLNINAEEEVSIQTKKFNVSAEDEANVDTPKVSMTHELSVAEKITGTGGLSMTGGDGAHIDSLNVTFDAVIGGKSYLGHRHPETGTITLTPQ